MSLVLLILALVGMAFAFLYGNAVGKAEAITVDEMDTPVLHPLWTAYPAEKS